MDNICSSHKSLYRDFLSTRPTILGEPPPVSLLLWSRGGLVIECNTGVQWIRGLLRTSPLLHFPSQRRPLSKFLSPAFTVQADETFKPRVEWSEIFRSYIEQNQGGLPKYCPSKPRVPSSTPKIPQDTPILQSSNPPTHRPTDGLMHKSVTITDQLSNQPTNQPRK